MSTTSKKTIINPEDKKYVESLPTTADLYREVDQQIRIFKEEEKRRKKVLVRETVEHGEELLQEIEEKRIAKEEKRVEMIEYIYDTSKEEFVTLKETKNMPYEEVEKVYNNVKEYYKPWWRKVVNVFR